MKRGAILRLWKQTGGTIAGPQVSKLEIDLEPFWAFLLKYEEMRGNEIIEEIARRKAASEAAPEPPTPKKDLGP